MRGTRTDRAVTGTSLRAHCFPPFILSGEFGGARVAYLEADRDLGVIIEIFSGTPDDRPQPDETNP